MIDPRRGPPDFPTLRDQLCKDLAFKIKRYTHSHTREFTASQRQPVQDLFHQCGHPRSHPTDPITLLASLTAAARPTPRPTPTPALPIPRSPRHPRSTHAATLNTYDPPPRSAITLSPEAHRQLGRRVPMPPKRKGSAGLWDWEEDTTQEGEAPPPPWGALTDAALSLTLTDPAVSRPAVTFSDAESDEGAAEKARKHPHKKAKRAASKLLDLVRCCCSRRSSPAQSPAARSPLQLEHAVALSRRWTCPTTSTMRQQQQQQRQRRRRRTTRTRSCCWRTLQTAAAQGQQPPGPGQARRPCRGGSPPPPQQQPGPRPRRPCRWRRPPQQQQPPRQGPARCRSWTGTRRPGCRCSSR
jgi:hypothetical protein